MQKTIQGMAIAVFLLTLWVLVASSSAANAAQQSTTRPEAIIGSIAPTRSGAFEETPDPDGNYIYEATSARPLVEGGRCELEENRIVDGLTVVRSDGGIGMRPDHSTHAGIYWELGEIEPGEYWIGVVYEGEGEVGSYGPLTVYLNGRIVQMATQSNPVQVAPGKWFIEALAADAELLRAGDEVGVVFHWGKRAARIVLHRDAPDSPFETPWRMPRNFGGHQWNLYTALGVTAEGRFRLSDGRSAPNVDSTYNAIQQRASSLASLEDPSGKVTFNVWLANPLPVAVTVDYQCAVKTFYAKTVAREEQRLTLAPHERIERTIPFQWDPKEVTHFADITVRGVNPPDLSLSREAGGAGWPEHETVTYFPRQRQLLPWPDPFNTRVVRRITLDTPAGGMRQTHSLDGKDWEIGYTTALEPPMPYPDDLTFDAVQVPHPWSWPKLDSMNPRPHGAYFRRTFTLPAELGKQSYRLQVEDVGAEATAYVNGRKAGNVRGERAPLIADITGLVQPGQNQLVIVVRDLIAIMNPDYVNKDAPEPNQDYLEAPGLHSRFGLSLGSVSIRSAPAVSSEDLLVMTSVRNGDIATRITVANRGSTAAGVRLVAEVLDDGEPVLTVGKKDLVLEPNAPESLTLQRDWENPTLWEPGQPHLYTLQVTLLDAESGETLDIGRERFGFSESWIAGPDIMFNGRPIKPMGYGPRTRFHPDGNFQLIRGGGQDWLDEVGLIAYKGITGIYNAPSRHNVENDNYWRTAEQNSLATLKLWQNSPHILAWDISNEWFWFLRYKVKDLMPGARRFKHLSDQLRAYDPTRWTLANSEGDFNGLLDNASYHYLNPYRSSDGFGMRGHSPYYPDGEFWRALTRHLRKGEAVPLSPLHSDIILKPHEKVIMDNEFLWKVGHLMPPGLTVVAGEDDVVSPAVDTGSGPVAWMWKSKIDGHRDLGLSVTGIHQSHLPGVMRGGYCPQALIVPENQLRGFAGAEQSRRFTVINGLFAPADMTVRWTLTTPDGPVVQAGDFEFALPSGGIYRDTFTFKLPDVKQITRYALRATLEADGTFACAEEWDLDVWPDEPIQAGLLARKVVLFEPTSNIEHRTSNIEDENTPGSTAWVLKQAGVAFERVSDPGAPTTPAEQTLLVIGENALTEENAQQTAGLADFVAAGGRVLVLRQNHAPDNLPVTTKLEPRHWASQVFLRMGNHPAMKGLDDMDLHFWQPDRSVATGIYTKPESGNFIVLADSGGAGGMENAHVMELFRGGGAYLLCQIPVIGRYGEEPMARELLARLVHYCAGEDSYLTPTGSITVLAEKKSPILQRLKDLGAKTVSREQWAVGGETSSPNGAVLVDASAARERPPAERTALAGRLRAGGTLVVCGATPEDESWLRELSGQPVRITAPPYPIWKGRGYRRGWSRWTAGLSQPDLYWKRFEGSQGATAQAEDAQYTIEPLQNGSVQVDGGIEHVFPGALVEMKVGEGVLLLDQRRWWTNNQKLGRQASRNVSALLTGLNVNIAPAAPLRALPADIAYRPIDLTPYANRGLADEVGDDGKGGFTDQGPGTDLRTFPTGPQLFKGVPFRIGSEPAICVVLASTRRPGYDRMPTEVTIPLNYAVEGLYMLHNTAWGGSPTAVYTIRYADGESVEIPLISGENIHDWAGPKPFLREKGTQSVIAWIGSTPTFDRVGVYRMLWVNPRPEVPIESIRFWAPKPHGSVPVLIGITAVVNADTHVSDADSARARALLQEAREADASGKLERALERLDDAVSDDPNLGDAYRLMLDVAEKTGNEGHIIEAAWKWGISSDASPAPWNRIAEIRERQGNHQAALEAYKKSLEIEWNQPPVLDAVQRLEEKQPASVAGESTTGGDK